MSKQEQKPRSSHPQAVKVEAPAGEQQSAQGYPVQMMYGYPQMQMVYGYPQMFQQPMQAQQTEPACKCKCEKCKCEEVRLEMEKKMNESLDELKKEIFEK